MNLTGWTLAAIFLGIGVVFIAGIVIGIKISQKAVDDALADAAMKGVLEYKNVRFIPVISGGRSPPCPPDRPTDPIPSSK